MAKSVATIRVSASRWRLIAECQSIRAFPRDEARIDRMHEDVDRFCKNSENGDDQGRSVIKPAQAGEMPMYEAAAYSQNVFKVMLDPATWLIAAIAVFALKGWPAGMRVAIALAANAAFILAWLVWPAGDSGRPYAWTAFFYELLATAIWCGLFLSARRVVKGRWV